MPDTVMTVFQDAVDAANKGLINWIFKHRGMKLLSVLSLPYTLPADIVLATFNKFQIIPRVSRTPRLLLTRLTETDFVTYIGNSIETHSLQYNIMGNAMVRRDHLALTYPNQKRFLSAAPVMGNSLWDMSKYMMDQMNSMLQKSNVNQQQHAKVTCQLAITEYGGSKYDIEACQDVPLSSKNKVNLNFTLNYDEKSVSVANSQRHMVAKTDAVDDDTFDHILQVTAQHEAVMAYYYMDEDNKVKVTEIFDVTDSDVLQSPLEKETNMCLEYDDDEWNEQTWDSDRAAIENTENYIVDDVSSLGLSELSIEDFNDSEPLNILSDPESEWNATTTTPRSDFLDRPESDQPTEVPTYRKPYKVPAMSYEHLEDH